MRYFMTISLPIFRVNIERLHWLIDKKRNDLFQQENLLNNGRLVYADFLFKFIVKDIFLHLYKLIVLLGVMAIEHSTDVV